MILCILLIFIAVSSVLTNKTVAAEKNGWWIRVDTGRTQASSITFFVGTSEHDRRPWFTWKSGDSTEFDVPVDFRNVSTLYIHATSNPDGRNSWFCLMYKQHGVKHFDFDDVEDHQENQNNSDDEC